MRPSQSIPDHIRILVLDGVEYWIEWERLLPGCSFFLKTVMPAAQVQRHLRPAEEHLRIDLKAQQRHEMGFYGVRVWRIA
jgi:hypothetical protein